MKHYKQFEQKQHEELTDKYTKQERIQNAIGSHVRALKGRLLSDHDERVEFIKDQKKDVREIMTMIKEFAGEKLNAKKSLVDIKKTILSTRCKISAIQEAREEIEQMFDLLEVNDDSVIEMIEIQRAERESRKQVIDAYLDDLLEQVHEVFPTLQGNVDWSAEIQADMQRIAKNAVEVAQDEGYCGA